MAEEANEQDGPEVTQEMVEAGVAALREELFGDYEFRGRSPADIVTFIYRAMAGASQAS